jgi:peptidoglycan/xylan/chitin deacetylase (PgdA/CDA1 family)
MTRVILMYHRVCPRQGTRPWFARGTAVTPDAFDRQLAWLSYHFDIVPLRTLLASTERRGNRPLASLTFDDGHADVFHEVHPRCAARGVVGTVFPVEGHLAGLGRELWFDTLYSLLEASLDPTCPDTDPSIDGVPLSSWVRGPEKEALQVAPSTERGALLARLADRLGVAPCEARELYLSEADLHDLVARGWTVGAHGVTHTRFTALSNADLQSELAKAKAFVNAFDRGEPLLAYPDGAADPRVRASVSAAGIRWAFTVTPGPVPFDQPFDPLAIPRVLCRGEGDVPSPLLPRLLGP